MSGEEEGIPSPTNPIHARTLREIDDARAEGKISDAEFVVLKEWEDRAHVARMYMLQLLVEIENADMARHQIVVNVLQKLVLEETAGLRFENVRLVNGFMQIDDPEGDASLRDICVPHLWCEVGVPEQIRSAARKVWERGAHPFVESSLIVDMTSGSSFLRQGVALGQVVSPVTEDAKPRAPALRYFMIQPKPFPKDTAIACEAAMHNNEFVAKHTERYLKTEDRKALEVMKDVLAKVQYSNPDLLPVIEV